MKVILLLSLFPLLINCSGKEDQQETAAKTGEAQGQRISDSLQLVRVTKDFFDGFDNRDLKKIDGLLLPETKIIHYNGVTTNTAEMNRIIQDTRNWYPRTRKLWNYELIADQNVAVVGFNNDVVFLLPGNKKVEEKYIETWTFRKMDSAWKPMRISYAKVVTNQHSEEVDPNQ